MEGGGSGRELGRIAAVAGRGIRKLRRNWSLRKEDLSKGLSRIKRTSKNIIEEVYSKDGVFCAIACMNLNSTLPIFNFSEVQLCGTA